MGATDSTDKRASFSDFGPVLDLFAPGVDVMSSATPGGYASASGTSAAAPYAAGAAALLREVRVCSCSRILSGRLPGLVEAY